MFFFQDLFKHSFVIIFALGCALILPNMPKAEAANYMVGASVNSSDEPASAGDWVISLGGGGVMRPEFEGSDKYDMRFWPIASVNYQNRFFISTQNGLGMKFFHDHNWSVGAAIRYKEGRDENDSTLLKGMGDIDSGAEIGVFGTWTPDPFSVRLEIMQGTGDVEGLQSTLTLGHTQMLAERLKWINLVGATYANSTHNDTFFGVSQRQSARSGYDYYKADSGFKSVQYTSRVSYALTADLSATGFGTYKRLVDQAADSPLVEAGSKNQFMFGLGLVYTFRP